MKKSRAAKSILEANAHQSSNRHSHSLTPFSGEGNEEIMFHIHIPLPRGLVESQGWDLLFDRIVVQVVFSKYPGNDNVQLGICKIDSKIRQGETTSATVEMKSLPCAHSCPL